MLVRPLEITPNECVSQKHTKNNLPFISVLLPITLEQGVHHMGSKSRVKISEVIVVAGLLCITTAFGIMVIQTHLTSELMRSRHDRIQVIAADSQVNKTVIDAYDRCWMKSFFPPKDGCITDAVIAGRAAGASDAELTGIFKRFPIVGDPSYCRENSYGCNPMWIGTQEPDENTKLFNVYIALKYPKHDLNP